MSYKVLGIDISTARIGFCELSLFDMNCSSMDLSQYSLHKSRRQVIRQLILSYKPSLVVTEAVRLFTYDFKNKKSFINVNAVKKLAIVTAVIEDNFDCPTKQIDVRSWKSAVFGTSKVEKNYSEVYIKQKYDIIVNNDLADAICIAEAGLYFPNKLKEIK